MTSTAVEIFRRQKLRPHEQALKTGRSAAQLLTVATQLKETCRRLQEERSQLLQQQHLLWSLAEVLSSYRASLQDDWDLSTADLEQVLLQQLTGVQVPSVTSTSHWPSTDSSAASNDSISSATGSGQSSEQVASDSSSTSSESSREGSLDHSYGQSSAADWCSSLCTLSTLGISSTSGCANAAAAAGSMQSLQQQADQPACPAHDPFRLLREAMDQPHDPHAAHLTLAGLCARWAADVHQLREYLVQLETGSHASTYPTPAESSSHPSSRAGLGRADGDDCSSVRVPAQPATDPIQGIKDVQHAMFVTTWSLPFVNKGHLFFELQLTDWHTGQRLQEPCKQRHLAALRALQLTPAQLQRMATGWQLFQRLLQPLVRMRKQLHARGVQVPEQDQDACCRTAAHSTDAAPLQQSSSSVMAMECQGVINGRSNAAASSSGSAGATGVFAGTSSHGARLQAQQEQVSEMRVLMRKDMLLRGAMAMHLQGCMSWRQQAKLRVMMSPYQLNVGIFYVVLMEHIQQEQPQLLATLRQQPTPQAAASCTGAMFGAAAAGAAAGAATAPSPFLGRSI